MTLLAKRRRWILPLLIALAAAVWLVLGRRAPADQTVHVVLGDRAPSTRELSVRYAPVTEPGAWDRDVSFRFEPGSAPRVVTHTPRLANGDYRVEIEVISVRTPSEPPETRVRVDRKITLEGGSVSIDVSQAR